MFTVDNLPAVLNCSIEGENNILQYVFDFSAWVEEYGEGTFFIKALRPTETEPYSVPSVTIQDNIAVWTVSNIDTAIDGIGAIELNYSSETFHKKSPIIKTYIKNALPTDGSVPSAYTDWLEQITELAESAEQSAKDAAESAEAAAQYIINFTDNNADGNVVIYLGNNET